MKEAKHEKQKSSLEASVLKKQARLETRTLRKLQLSLQQALISYMKKHKIGFNEVVRRLKSHPEQIAKIKNGKANLTLTSIARLSVLLEEEPALTFKKRS